MIARVTGSAGSKRSLWRARAWSAAHLPTGCRAPEASGDPLHGHDQLGWIPNPPVGCSARGAHVVGGSLVLSMTGGCTIGETSIPPHARILIATFRHCRVGVWWDSLRTTPESSNDVATETNTAISRTGRAFASLSGVNETSADG